jgi:hypothetical protein
VINDIIQGNRGRSLSLSSVFCKSNLEVLGLSVDTEATRREIMHANIYALQDYELVTATDCKKVYFLTFRNFRRFHFLQRPAVIYVL